MNLALTLAIVATGAIQGHDSGPPAEMKEIAFLEGQWAGEQAFNNPGSPLIGKATDRISPAVGGRYLEERLSTTLPGRAPTDTRHFITFDRKDGKFKAWWFNDTSTAPSEYDGTLVGNTLTLDHQPSSPQGPVLRATYVHVSDHELTFTLAMKNGDEWTKLFLSTYHK